MVTLSARKKLSLSPRRSHFTNEVPKTIWPSPKQCLPKKQRPVFIYIQILGQVRDGFIALKKRKAGAYVNVKNEFSKGFENLLHYFGVNCVVSSLETLVYGKRAHLSYMCWTGVLRVAKFNE